MTHAQLSQTKRGEWIPMANKPQNGTPAYRRIFNILQSEIESGAYDKVRKLPSENYLATRFDVQRNTVRKSLKLLTEAGITASRPGQGTWLKDRNNENETSSALEAGAKANNSIVLIAQEDYFSSADSEHFHLRVFDALEKCLSSQGYNLIVKKIEKGASIDSVVAQSQPIGIIFDSYNSPENYQAAARLTIPAISVDHYTPHLVSVVCANYDAAYSAVAMLHERGHEKVAVLTGKPNYQTTKERLSGVHSYYKQRGEEFDESLLFVGDWRFSSGVKAAESILELPQSERPTAIFAFNDDMAYGCLSRFERAGLSIPGDISVVGFDNSGAYADIFRPITTIDVNVGAIVEYVCWYLLSRLNGGISGVLSKIQIATAIVDNGTVRAI